MKLDLIKIDTSHDQPLYLQIAEQIRKLIASGELKPGDKLPVSRQLQKELGLSSVTVENGISILVKEGYLIRRPRIGTFVADKSAEKNIITTKTSIIKVVFTDILPHGDYWLEILFDLEAESKKRHCQLMFLRNSPPQLITADDLQQDCQGIIMCGTNPSRLAREINSNNFPLVLIGSLDTEKPPIKNLDIIVNNDTERSYLGLRHLLALGHRQIAAITAPTGSQFNNMLILGITKAAAEFSLTDSELTIISATSASIESGREVASQILCSKKTITGIYVSDQFIAIGVLQAIQQLGLQVPEDISLITLGSNWINDTTNPALTAIVATEENNTASVAIEHLFWQINDPDYSKKTTVLNQIFKLSLRNSTKFLKSNTVTTL